MARELFAQFVDKALVPHSIRNLLDVNNTAGRNRRSSNARSINGNPMYFGYSCMFASDSKLEIRLCQSAVQVILTAKCLHCIRRI